MQHEELRFRNLLPVQRAACNDDTLQVIYIGQARAKYSDSEWHDHKGFGLAQNGHMRIQLPNDSIVKVRSEAADFVARYFDGKFYGDSRVLLTLRDLAVRTLVQVVVVPEYACDPSLPEATMETLHFANQGVATPR